MRVRSSVCHCIPFLETPFFWCSNKWNSFLFNINTFLYGQDCSSKHSSFAKLGVEFQFCVTLNPFSSELKWWIFHRNGHPSMEHLEDASMCIIWGNMGHWSYPGQFIPSFPLLIAMSSSQWLNSSSTLTLASCMSF